MEKNNDLSDLESHLEKSEAKSEDCCTNRKIGDLLDDYIQDSLPQDKKGIFDAHLLKCDFCLNRYEEELALMNIIVTVELHRKLLKKEHIQQSAAG